MKTKIRILTSTFLLFLFFPYVNGYSNESAEGRNTVVGASMERELLPIFKSFDSTRLERLGFLPLDSTTETKMSGAVHNGYRVSIRGAKPLNSLKGSMYGMVFWQGGEQFKVPGVTLELPMLPKILMLSFGKLSHDTPWKLLIHDGHIEEPSDDLPSPELQAYIKSKFETMESMEFFIMNSKNK